MPKENRKYWQMMRDAEQVAKRVKRAHEEQSYRGKIDQLQAENAKLRAALERLIKDYEDETNSPATAARKALED
jgi:hypothetical protein